MPMIPSFRGRPTTELPAESGNTHVPPPSISPHESEHENVPEADGGKAHVPPLSSSLSFHLQPDQDSRTILDLSASSSSWANSVLAASSSTFNWEHDVFLSFRGEDTRHSFTDHLYYALNQRGIDTFRDTEKLRRGRSISPELLKAIEESKFAVIVISINYATSSWCLDELAHIAECMKLRGLKVLQVFYHVEPSQVRKQTGDFGKGFTKLEEDFNDNFRKVNKWREALKNIACLSGWHVTKDRRGLPGKPDGESHYIDYDLFSIGVYHGGEITSKSYVGGSIAWFDYCDKDQISMLEIDLMVKELGYNTDPHHIEPIKYWYKVFGDDFSRGLTLLQVDQDVVEMVKLVPKVTRTIDILLEHVNPRDLLESQLLSSVPVFDDDEDQSLEVTLLERSQRIKKANDPLVEGTSKLNGKLGKKVETDVIFLDGKSYGKEVATAVTNIGGKSKNKGKEIAIDLASYLPDSSDDDNSVFSYGESEYGGDKDDDTDWLEKYIDKSIEWVGSSSKMNEVDGTGEAWDFDVEEEERCESELHSASDSDNEGKTFRWPEFNASTDMKNVHFKLGMIFTDCKMFREAVTNYCIQNGKEVNYLRNERYKLSVKCKSKGCPWALYAGRHENDCLLLKTCGPEHTCGRIFENKMVKSKWLAATYVDKIKSNPEWPVQSMKDQFQEDYNCGATDMKIYRAKKRAFNLIEGSHREQYAKLWDYAEEIRRTNPGSTVIIKTELVNDEPKFERMYICLGACKKGFKDGCRPLIGLDGCHLKGPYGGQLLTAVGIDANNQCWVIAYAIVEVENKSSWVWFLELLVDDLKIDNEFGFTFISDKQKGLIGAFELVVPNSHQRFCARHLLSNFQLQYKGKVLKDKLWECARATTVEEFGRKMDEMKSLSKEAFDWLAQKPPSQWSKSHFNTDPKCDMLLNNICESFNAQLLRARSKPVLTCLEMIRTLLMKRIQVRRDGMRKYPGKICPKPKGVIESNKVLAGKWVAAWNGGDRFQVSYKSEQFVVDLHDNTCTCRKWELTGIPCEHAISSINYVGGEKLPEDYVDEQYFTKTFLKSYENLVNPLNGPLLWKQTGFPAIIPPTYFRPPGRPKKLRRKEPSELENTNKLPRSGRYSSCGICRQKGHNARTHHKHLETRPSTSNPITRSKKTKEVKKIPSSSVPSTSEPPSSPKNKRTTGKKSQTVPVSCSAPSNSGPSKSPNKRVLKEKTLAELVSTTRKTTGRKKTDKPNASASQADPHQNVWSHL